MTSGEGVNALCFPSNVRFWCKAAVGLIRAQCPLLTQSGHSPVMMPPSAGAGFQRLVRGIQLPRTLRRPSRRPKVAAHRKYHLLLHEVGLHYRLVDVGQLAASGGGGDLDEFGLQDLEHALGAGGAEGA